MSFVMSLEFRYAGVFWSAVYIVAVIVAVFVVFLCVRKANRGRDGSAMAWFATGILGISYVVGYIAGNSTTSVAVVIAGGLVAVIASVTSVVLEVDSAKTPVATDNGATSRESLQAQDQLSAFSGKQRTGMMVVGVFLICLAVGELGGVLAGGRAKDNYNCIRDARATGKSLSDIQESGLTTIGNVGTQVPLSMPQTTLQASPSGESPSVH